MNSTIEHFLKIADRVIIIGSHPTVNGTLSLQPSITSTKEKFLVDLQKLEVENVNDLVISRQFFFEYTKDKRVMIIDPYNIFCEKKCVTHDDYWSYFSDKQHVSNAATGFIKQRI